MKVRGSKKLGYPAGLQTQLYNAYPSLDQIKITHDPTHPDAKYKVVDNTNIGVLPDSLADLFLINLGDP